MSETSLGLSDQEFLEKDPAEFLEPVEETGSEDNKETNTSDQTDDSEEPSQEEVSEAQEQTEVEATQDEVSQPEGDTQTEPEKSTDSDTTESLDTSTDDSTDTKEDTPETTELDYKSAFKKVTSPFKANGVDMQVTDPNDIVRLMQMGANYQKKMSQLKPNLKLIKMLENNDLLNEARLNNLIDLSKKDPKAITKLIKESSIDPLEIDKDAPVDYQPTNYSVTDKEYELDRILDDIKHTKTFDKTIDTLTKDWDASSKELVSDNPEIIGVINTHMGNGVFDKVNSIMQQERTLGKLDGIPDVEAYRMIVEHMHKSGALIDKSQSPTTASKVSSNSGQEADADRNKKRKAVAPVKQTATKTPKKEEDFLGLSDEEFMKKYAAR
jgi:hypothetical protein